MRGGMGIIPSQSESFFLFDLELRLLFSCTLYPDPPVEMGVGVLYRGQIERYAPNHYKQRAYDVTTDRVRRLILEDRAGRYNFFFTHCRGNV